MKKKFISQEMKKELIRKELLRLKKKFYPLLYDIREGIKDEYIYTYSDVAPIMEELQDIKYNMQETMKLLANQMRYRMSVGDYKE